MKSAGMLRWLALYYMLLRTGNNTLYLAMVTLLLKRGGVEMLPWLYTLANVLLIYLQLGVVAKAEGKVGRPLLSLMSWPLLAFSLVLSLFTNSDNSWLFLVGLILLTQIEELGNLGFANYTSQLLSIQEAKRSQPVIYAAGSFGLFASGISLKLLLDVVDLRELLWINALVHLAADAVLTKIGALERAAAEVGGADAAPSRRVAAAVTDTQVAPPPAAWLHPLVALLVMIVGLRTCNKYVVDYLYSGAVNEYFRSPKDLASFLGVFGATVDLTVIGMQSLVAGWAFARFPIGRVLSVLPVVMVLFCGVATVWQTLPLVVALQFALLVLTRTLLTPSNNLLLAAVRPRERVGYHRAVFVASAAGTLAAGAVLLLVRGRLPAPLLFATMAVFYGVLLIWISRLDRAYVATLKDTLSRAQTDGTGENLDEDTVTALRWVALDERLPRLRELLGHADPAVRLQVIAEVEDLPAAPRRELVLSRLSAETEARCQVALARILLADLGPDAVTHFERLLVPGAEPRLVADLLEVLGRIGAGDAGQRILLAHLDDPRHRVRGSAVMGVVRQSRRSDELTRALAGLARMATHTEALMWASAAAVMGELGLPLFIGALEVLAHDGDLVVARNAMNALARLRTSRALSILQALALGPVGAPNSERREVARRLYAEASRGSVDRLGTLMQRLSAADRQDLVRSLKTMKGEGPMQVLGRVLALEDPTLRSSLVKLLTQSDPDGFDLIGRCVVGDDSGRVCLALDPVWTRLRETAPISMPTWAEVMSCAGVADPTAWRHGTLEMLHWLWHEAVLMEVGPEVYRREAAIAGSQPSEIGEVMALGFGWDAWRQRAETGCRLVMLGFPNPTELLAALDRVRAADAFTRAIAEEYLETQLGAELTAVLLPIWRFDAGREGWRALARERVPPAVENVELPAVLALWQRIDAAIA